MTAVEFEIRVAGSVPDDVLEELRDVRVVTESVETLLRGPVRDQAELIGILNRLQDWGIELRGVRQLAPRGCPPARNHRPARSRATD